eukprot:1677041-Prymnesium_polylepis.1
MVRDQSRTVAAVLCIVLHVANVAAITIEGGQQHEDSDIDSDEFLWEKLPGRCCFYGNTPRSRDPHSLPFALLAAHRGRRPCLRRHARPEASHTVARRAHMRGVHRLGRARQLLSHVEAD